MSSAALRPGNGFSTSRASRVLILGLFHACAPMVKALPFGGIVHALADEDTPKSPADASLWLYLGIAIALVLGGGVFAGLTIAQVDFGPSPVQPYANCASAA